MSDMQQNVTLLSVRTLQGPLEAGDRLAARIRSCSLVFGVRRSREGGGVCRCGMQRSYGMIS